MRKRGGEGGENILGLRSSLRKKRKGKEREERIG
jgi:hypothetical protein